MSCFLRAWLAGISRNSTLLLPTILNLAFPSNFWPSYLPVSFLLTNEVMHIYNAERIVSQHVSSVIGSFNLFLVCNQGTGIILVYSGVSLMNSSQEGVPKNITIFINDPWVLTKYFLSCRGYQQSFFFLICWGDNELTHDTSYSFGLPNPSRLFPITPHSILSLCKPVYPQLFSSFFTLGIFYNICFLQKAYSSSITFWSLQLTPG